MKQSLKRILTSQTVLLTAIFLSACQSPLSTKQSDQYQIPWLSSDGKYELTPVTISSLSDPGSLKSDLVQLFVTPSEGEGGLAAPEAIGKFMTRADGVRVPLDFVSLQGAVIHAHFERFHKFDQAAGASSLGIWPVRIAIETQVMNDEFSKNNAFFDGSRNAILILPFTDDTKEGLPISLNGGVLAHEHFHGIFDRLVNKKLVRAGIAVKSDINELFAPEAPGELPAPSAPPAQPGKPTPSEPRLEVAAFNDLLLRAVNEGLADFWAWLNTSDDHFVGRSIKIFAECRRLDREFAPLPTAQELNRILLSSADVSGKKRDFISYQIGTRYARFLKEAVKAAYPKGLTDADKAEVARAVVGGLRSFGEVAVQQYESTVMSSDQIIKTIIENLPIQKVSPKICQLYEEFKPSSSIGLRSRLNSAVAAKCSGVDPNSQEVLKNRLKRLQKMPGIQQCECTLDANGKSLCD